MKKPISIISPFMFWIFFITIGTFSASPAMGDQMPAGLKPINLIFATYDRNTSDPGVATTQFMNNITKRTNGLVKFRAYYSAAMGGAQEVFPSITSGMVQIGYSRTMYYPGKFQLATIDELPFTGYLMDARQKAYMQLIEEFPELRQEFSKQKLKFLSPLQSSAPALASKKDMMTLNDWKNVKIRAGGTGAILVKAWGGVPVSIATANIYEAISRGTVDGAFGFPPGTMVAFGLHEVSKYFIDTGTGALGMLSLVMNQDAYDKLPPAVRKIFDEEAAALGQIYPEVRMNGMRRMIPKAIAAGCEIVSMPNTEQAKMVEVGKGQMHEKWVKSLSEKGYDEEMLRKMLARLLVRYDQNAKGSQFTDFWALYEKEFKK